MNDSLKKGIATGVAVLALGGVILTTPLLSEELVWKHSYETLRFNTQSKWIEPGQYAVKEKGDGYYVCDIKEVCSPDIILHEEELSYDLKDLTEVSIVGSMVFDYFQDPETDEISKFNGNVEEYKKLQSEKDYPQPQKNKRSSIISNITPVAHATILSDAVANDGVVTNPTSISWSHTVTSSGSDRILLAYINTNDITSGDRLVTLATYNSVQMSTTTTRYAGATTEGAPFHLVNPSTGANTVSITFGGTVSSSIGASISFTGVHQSSPFVQNNVTCAKSGCALENASSTSWWVHHIVENSDDTFFADETCLHTQTMQISVDSSSGSLGNYVLTCAPIIPNAQVNRSGTDNVSGNGNARAYELRNSNHLATATSTAITYTSADLYGIVYSLNGEASQDAFFEYGTTLGGPYTATSSIDTVSSVPQEFSSTISGLTHNTTYYYRVGMEAPGGTLIYDTEGNFTTPCNPSGNVCEDEFTMEVNLHPNSLSLSNSTRRFSSWTAPTGVTNADVACWGAGGGGGADTTNGGGGGGGGAFASSTLVVTPGTTYWITIGAYGFRDSATNLATSTFATTTVVADGGRGVTANIGGTGGLDSLSVGDIVFGGGTGGAADGTNDIGGGGGGAAGFAGAGGNGDAAAGGGTAGADGGDGNNGIGGAGGAGGNASSGGEGGDNDYGGGGGGGSDTNTSGGRGGDYGGGGGGSDVITIHGVANGRGMGGRCTVTYTSAAVVDSGAPATYKQIIPTEYKQIIPSEYKVIIQ